MELLRFLVLVLVLGFSGSCVAVDFNVNDFASLVAGEVRSGDVEVSEYIDYDCPCFIADYNNGTLYEDGELRLDYESRAGIQLNIVFTDAFSLVTQAVYRAIDSEASIEWAYLSWNISPSWTFQAGRKRIPMYYYSEFQDVGLSYTWVRPPQALYGWEASNYNGGSLRYTGGVGDWNLTASVYAGSEEVDDAPYTRIYDFVAQDVKWDNIRGGDIEVSYEWFTGRFIYMTSENSITEKPDSSAFSAPATEQTVMGLALNGDFGNWFVLTEFNVNTRENSGTGLDVEAPAVMLGTGYRMGQFTPFVSWSRYWEKSADLEIYEPERFTDLSFTLRYDINASNALKFQIDQYKDKTSYGFVGDTTVMTLVYDLVF